MDRIDIGERIGALGLVVLFAVGVYAFLAPDVAARFVARFVP